MLFKLSLLKSKEDSKLFGVVVGFVCYHFFFLRKKKKKEKFFSKVLSTKSLPPSPRTLLGLRGGEAGPAALLRSHLLQTVF